jgi:hypothetical protein
MPTTRLNVVFIQYRCPYCLDSNKIEILIQDIQNEFDAILDSGEFYKFKDILGKTIIFRSLLCKGGHPQFKSVPPQLRNIADNQIDCGIAD